jgi:hypothetical protein
MNWRVEISPSIFREHECFELGQYRWAWSAWLAGWWYVSNHPHAEARIQRRLSDG